MNSETICNLYNMHCISNFNAINFKKKNYKEEILGVSDKALPQGF